MILSGWGRYPKIDAKISSPRCLDELLKLLKRGDAIARGNGRAYGDSAISAKNTIHMKHFNRMLVFDAKVGQLVAEAGVMLADIIDVFLPRGWFPSVSPGTKFVTLGGMIAADVHGKNHHKDGSFGNYIDWIDIITNDGSVQRCSKTKNIELFEWTIGGMGLTGIILRAAIRLRPVSSAWIEQRTLVANNITHAIELLEQTKDATYSVAWIDCLQKGATLGRSLVMLGEHAKKSALPLIHRKQPLKTPVKKKIRIRFDFPSWTLNNVSIRAFNSIYYWNGKHKSEKQLVDWDSYFYPLDSILGWNKIYGRHGFVQFQCVISKNNASQGLNELINTIANAGIGSFLAVLKMFGPQQSKFSFPMEGYTLALDFPVNNKTLNLMDKLDIITLKHGGRFYLAKDSRISQKKFLQSDIRAKSYRKYRQIKEMSSSFQSSQSKRLKL